MRGHRGQGRSHKQCNFNGPINICDKSRRRLSGSQHASNTAPGVRHRDRVRPRRRRMQPARRGGVQAGRIAGAEQAQAAQAAGGADAAGGSAGASNKPADDDNVVDAEVKEVKKG